jgi:hypothetical protein
MKAIKQITVMLLALCLNLVWANSIFDDIVFFQHQISNCSECPDTSDPGNYSHSISCEDDVFIHDSLVKSNIFGVTTENAPVLTDNFRNLYLNNIWQPPKIS